MTDLKVLPVFTSHYSIGRSILTLKAPSKVTKGGPDSIVQLCVDNNIKDLYLVENNFSGFIEAYKNTEEAGLNLRFGLRLTITDDMAIKTPESFGSDHKVIIFIRNFAGYEDLVKISSIASCDGLAYSKFQEEQIPRIDFKTLIMHFNSDNLFLAVPFYDSFLHRNLLYSATISPIFNFCNPIFFLESNDLPFDSLIGDAVRRYTSTEDNIEILPTKTIYYVKKDDFKAYCTFRCINNRTVLSKPELNDLASDLFCLESWKEQND